MVAVAGGAAITHEVPRPMSERIKEEAVIQPLPAAPFVSAPVSIAPAPAPVPTPAALAAVAAAEAPYVAPLVKVITLGKKPEAVSESEKKEDEGF